MPDLNNFSDPTKNIEKPVTPQTVTLRYAIWDPDQAPVYGVLARRFQSKYPHITVKVEHTMWDAYWSKLKNSFAMQTTPDVFVTHITEQSSYIKGDHLIDLNHYVKRDQLDLSLFQEPMPDLWVMNDCRYALPKDWDTIAVIYNAEMFARAGISPGITETWTWNAEDTGTFNQCIARLTLDNKGNNGLSSQFNRFNIVQYGFLNFWGSSPSGQVTWGNFAMSNGAPPLISGSHYTLDDPKRIEAIQWYANLIKVKGFAPGFDGKAGLGFDTGLEYEPFKKGKAAMIIDGSWHITQYIRDCKFKVGFGLMPVGPIGRRTMLNGVGDVIWKGTKYREESWQWVKFLASPEAQDIVAEAGVVFPSLKSSSQKTLKTWALKNVDVSPYLKMVQNPEETFLYAPNVMSSNIHSVLNPALNLIMLGTAKAAPTLKIANEKMNIILQAEKAK